MDAQEGDEGSPIDPETACVACGTQDSPETMIICDRCQQGFHLGCFGLAAIPEEEEWVCQGCQQLHALGIGQHVVVEMAQTLYSDGPDPHLTQGLFTATTVSLEDIEAGVRKVQLLVDDCPVPDSLRFYSSSNFKQLRRLPKQSLQLGQLQYQRTASQLTMVWLASSRWGMFGNPAAAAGRSSEVWLSGPDALQLALAALQQPPKQMHLLSTSNQASGSKVRHSSQQQQSSHRQRHPEVQSDDHPVPQSSRHPTAIADQVAAERHPASAGPDQAPLPPLAESVTICPTAPAAASCSPQQQHHHHTQHGMPGHLQNCTRCPTIQSHGMNE